ncbi:MAG: hypothetical protein JXA01_07615 [Dehalococcoidia bacterium]|nr:hypothetical protein [Dehalococcoidia bacterium]
MPGTAIKDWKPVVFIAINVFFIVWLAIILETLLRVLGGDDPLALLGILIADAAFLVAGILLFVLNRYYPVLIANRILPFIAILALTLIAVLNVTDITLWAGIVITVVLILLSIATTIRNL